MARIAIETIRLVGGRRAEGTPPGILVLTPPRQPARQRAAERFVMLLDMGEQAPSWLYRQVRAAAARDFWSTPGSVTAALRRAIYAANRAIFHYNLRAAPPQRVYGAISCAALTESEVFVAQAGPTRGWALCGGRIERFPLQPLPPLGSGAYVETHVTYLPVQPGDRLVVASYYMARAASDDALRRVLGLEERAAVTDALEQVAEGQTCYALVACWEGEPEPAPLPQRKRRLLERPRPAPVSPASAPQPEPEAEAQLAEPVAVAVEEPPLPAVELRTDFDEPWSDEESVDLRPAARPIAVERPRPRVREGLERVWRRLSAGVAGGAARLRLPLRRPVRRARPATVRPPRAQRTSPPENSRLMAGVAAAILFVIAIVTVLTWSSYGGAVQRQQAIAQAQQHAELAREAVSPEEQRSHWASVVDILTTAGLAQAPESAALFAEAQGHLDRLDGVIRAQPFLLWPTEGTSAAQRLVIHASYAFLLDGERGSVTRLNMTATGEGMVAENEPILRSGEEHGGHIVAPLVDMAWNQSSGEWPMDCLVVLDANHQLWIYDAAWPERTYAMPLPTRAEQRVPVAIEAYGGRLYLLDRQAQQVWRYLPQSAGYVEAAEPYFSEGTPQAVARARDIAIDGNVYLLLEDGSVVRYFNGVLVPFEVRGVPPPLPRFVDIEVDPELAGRVYLADAAAERIVVLNEAGSFRSQLRTTGSEMQGLQALALDPANSRLFFLAAGRLYTLPLPLAP